MSNSPSHLSHLDDKLAAGMKRERAFRWVIVSIATFAMAMSGAGLIIVASQAGNNAGRINKVEPKVAKAAAAAKTAKGEATETRKTAQAARRSSKRVVRFLQGKQGIPGVRGSNGKLGAPGPQGPEGKRGPGPTPAQLNAATAACFQSGLCKADGVSRADVLAALTDYCNTHICRGATGDTGKAGSDGKDGKNGQDGAPPPQGFTLVYGDFIANCLQTDTATRTYTCTSPAPAGPSSP